CPGEIDRLGEGDNHAGHHRPLDGAVAKLDVGHSRRRGGDTRRCKGDIVAVAALVANGEVHRANRHGGPFHQAVEGSGHGVASDSVAVVVDDDVNFSVGRVIAACQRGFQRSAAKIDGASHNELVVAAYSGIFAVHLDSECGTIVEYDVAALEF